MAFGYDDLIGGAASIGGGILGNIASEPDRQRAIQAQQSALRGLQELQTNKNNVNFQQYKNAGSLDPRLQKTFQQGQSQMGGINTDPRYKQAQLSALGGLQQIGQNGMTIQDQANQNKVLSQQNSNEQGNRQAIQQSMAQRGMGGSGFDLASQMLNQQQSANRANQTGTDIAAQAQARSLQAMQGAGQLGSQMQGQDFGQQSQQARAQDAINRFNTQNQQQVGGQNTQRQNAAQQYNLGQAQTLSDKNTATANNQQVQNNQYNNDYYNQQFQRAQAVAGQQNTVAGAYNANANATAGMYGGMGQGIGKAVAANSAGNAADARWQGLTSALQGGNTPAAGGLAQQIGSYKIPKLGDDEEPQ